MTTLAYARPDDVATAVALVAGDQHASYLAGGTTHLDLLLKDGIGGSTRLVDISRLPLRGTTMRDGVLQIGALTTMAELADDTVVARELPLVREALLAGASPQLRTMATIGGNLLQRTRCRYFRDPLVATCNKRRPGSGCGAVAGVARMHAILGASEQCIAAHGSDLCVPLVALDAAVRVRGADGERLIPLTELYLLPRDRPHVETVLRHGELITQIDVPLLPAAVRSGYLKVRDRASYEFALVSVAAALLIDDGIIAEARVALGGVGTVPWRAREAEEVLRGAVVQDRTFEEAAQAALRDVFTVPGTQFKVELARRAIVRAFRTVAS